MRALADTRHLYHLVLISAGLTLLSSCQSGCAHNEYYFKEEILVESSWFDTEQMSCLARIFWSKFDPVNFQSWQEVSVPERDWNNWFQPAIALPLRTLIEKIVRCERDSEIDTLDRSFFYTNPKLDVVIRQRDIYFKETFLVKVIFSFDAEPGRVSLSGMREFRGEIRTRRDLDDWKKKFTDAVIGAMDDIAKHQQSTEIDVP